MSEEAQNLGVDLNKESAREYVYKMTYDQWKENHQLPVSDEKLEIFKQSKMR